MSFEIVASFGTESMSLVLIVHDDEVGLICSDGRISRTENGKTIVVTDDCPKFVVLRKDLVVAATGRADIANRVCSLASEHVRTKVPSFSGLENFLSHAIPRNYLAYPVQGSDVTVAVALVGFDGEQNRIRCVSWISADNFSKFEGNAAGVKTYVFGDAEAKDSSIELMKLKLTPLLSSINTTADDYFAILSSIIAGLAATHDGISSNTHTCLISRPDV